ncbi:GTPase HflX [Candidatus Babeliales bacterium]|nr:GTPase HflX [Candidatus Babeliales bacterium]
MSKKAEPINIDKPKVLLVGIQAPYNKTKYIDSYFAEFLNLAKTNQLEWVDVYFTKIRSIDASTFLTKGKLEEITKLCNEHNIDHVVISEPLTAQQARNLTELFSAKVFDRTQLILEIFEKAALSAEGKIQVEIAFLQYQKSRLAGHGIHMSQQAGGIGTRGLGETAKEKESRHIEEHILKLKKKLHQLELTRETQRKQRLANRIPNICLIGYTNAGKSTILNALTKSHVLAEDKLFATLDTTTRELFINGVKKGVISDTVGFIQQLPTRLIEAFKSTLSELQYADLLLHVIDLSDLNWESHIKIVHDILNDLNVHKDILYVFNKVDKTEDLEALKPALNPYRPQVLVSASSKDGLAALKTYLSFWTPER